MQILSYIILFFNLSYLDFISFILTYYFLCFMLNYNFIIFPFLDNLIFFMLQKIYYYMIKFKYIKTDKITKIIDFYLKIKNIRNKKYKQLNFNSRLQSDKDINLFLDKITNKNIS
jgi:hypothetical protein